jgi:hypothetical protein
MAHPSHNHTVPLGRSGIAEDVAGTVIWLASRSGAYVTGTSVDVDGGVSPYLCLMPHVSQLDRYPYFLGVAYHQLGE